MTELFHTPVINPLHHTKNDQYYIGQGNRGCTRIQGPHFAFHKKAASGTVCRRQYL